MATAFTLNRTQLAQRILGKVTKLGATTAASADTDTIYQALDLRLKDIHVLGNFWRKVTNVPVTFSLTASVATASAGAGDILFPLSMTFTNGSLDDPVDIIGIPEYAEIRDKNRSGNPQRALWKGGSEFIFWPVPSANGTAKITYEKLADDTSAGAAIDVDVSMLRSIIDLVKYDVADDYGVPEGIIKRWALEAKIAERNIQKLGAPRIKYEPVQVDDYDSVNTNTKTDWRTG